MPSRCVYHIYLANAIFIFFSTYLKDVQQIEPKTLYSLLLIRSYKCVIKQKLNKITKIKR